jgi:hypothetical protein
MDLHSDQVTGLRHEFPGLIPAKPVAENRLISICYVPTTGILVCFATHAPPPTIPIRGCGPPTRYLKPVNQYNGKKVFDFNDLIYWIGCAKTSINPVKSVMALKPVGTSANLSSC